MLATRLFNRVWRLTLFVAVVASVRWCCLAAGPDPFANPQYRVPQRPAPRHSGPQYAAPYPGSALPPPNVWAPRPIALPPPPVLTTPWPSAAQPQFGVARGATVVGRVVDADGRPLPQVTVVAAARGQRRVEATTDAAGRFRLDGLTPGSRYLILATATRSPVPMIGRVAAVPPDDNVVIAVSRPFTGTRRTDTRVAHVTPSPPTAFDPPSRASSTTPFDAAGPLHDSPWDMPAPPTRRTAPPRATNTSTTSTGQPRMHPRKTAEPDQELAEQDWATQDVKSDAGSLETGADTPNNPRAATERAADPRQPLARPIAIAAAPPFDQRQAATVKPRIEVEPIVPRHTPEVRQPTPTTWEGPQCSVDGGRLQDFDLPDLELNSVKFSSLPGKLVLLDFWGSWCEYCLKSVPHLAELQRRFGPLGLQVVGIAYESGSLEEKVKTATAVKEKLAVNYVTVLGDVGGPCPVKSAFNVRLFPTMVLVDKAGRVLWRCDGEADRHERNQLESIIKAQLAGG